MVIGDWKTRTQHEPWVNQASYSGCDIIPIVYGVDSEGKNDIHAIGDISTLTYSIHRDKGQVRTLGRVKPKGFTRGARTIGGTLVFSVFDRRALWDLSKRKNDETKRVAIADSLPGFDIILYFTNEYGFESTLILYNVQILDEGQSHSVQDMYIENTMGYIRQDIDLLEPKEISSFSLPSSAQFINDKRDTLRRAAGPGGLPLNYEYLNINK